jgi:hypothetical protein
MKRSIVTVLIIVAIGLVFSPRGGTQDKGATSIQKNADDNKNQAKPLAPPVVQSDAAHEAQNPSASVASQDIDHRVRIGTPVAVNSIKDRWDKALVISTGLIVVIGIFQIIFLWMTIISANASARALINSERAWVTTSIVWATTEGLIIEGTGTEGNTTVNVCLICTNDGKIPAWITKKAFRLGIFDNLPSRPDTRSLQSFGYSGPEPLSVGESTKVFMQPECNGRRPQVGGPSLVIYGVVGYRDAFGEHETWCGYNITGSLPRLERLAGYPEYNKST